MLKIVIIGSGNVATHLAKALYASHNTILQVYSPTQANAEALACAINSKAICSLEEIHPEADLYLIAVKDEAISLIVEALPKKLSGIVVHTSGATPIDVLNRFQNYGVIYPPQSLNKSIATDLSVIPFGIEGNSSHTYERLFEIIAAIAPKAFPCETSQRLALHLSAVLVNNFSNALFQMADEILKHENLSFDLLKPIILETAQKVQHNSPKETQTGPASRGDYAIIDKHLQFLTQFPEESKIYQLLSDFIVKRYHK